MKWKIFLTTAFFLLCSFFFSEQTKGQTVFSYLRGSRISCDTGFARQIETRDFYRERNEHERGTYKRSIKEVPYMYHNVIAWAEYWFGLKSKGEKQIKLNSGALKRYKILYILDSLGYYSPMDNTLLADSKYKNLTYTFLDSLGNPVPVKGLRNVYRQGIKSCDFFFRDKIKQLNDRVRIYDRKIWATQRIIRECYEKINGIDTLLDTTKVTLKLYSDVIRGASDQKKREMVRKFRNLINKGDSLRERGNDSTDVKLKQKVSFTKMESNGTLIADYLDTATINMAVSVVDILLDQINSVDGDKTLSRYNEKPVYILFLITGKADGIGAGLQVYTRNGCGSPAGYCESHFGKITNFQYQKWGKCARMAIPTFDDPQFVDAVGNFIDKKVFYNIELAFLRGYAFYYHTKEMLEKKKQNVRRTVIPEYKINAIEFTNRSDDGKFRGINVEIKIKGLLHPMSDSIKILQDSIKKMRADSARLEEGKTKSRDTIRYVMSEYESCAISDGGLINRSVEDILMHSSAENLKTIIQRRDSLYQNGIRTIYLVACVDSDTSMGVQRSTITSLKRLKNELKNVVKKEVFGKRIYQLDTSFTYTGYLYKKEYLVGNDGKGGILNNEYRFNPQKNDVIVFFYNGLGYFKGADTIKQKLPYMFVGDKDLDELGNNRGKFGVSFHEFCKVLNSKKANLKISIGELDNHPKINLPTLDRKHYKDTLLPNVDGLVKLFFERKGHISVVAARPYQRAKRTMNGGYLIDCFLSSIKKFDNNVEPDWEIIMKDTRSSVRIRSRKAGEIRQDTYTEMKVRITNVNVFQKIAHFFSKPKKL